MSFRLLPADVCLVEQVSEFLVNQISLPLHKFHVVLPTKRLQQFLIRELILKHGQATLLPKFWTWDQFVSDMTLSIQDKEVVMVSEQSELLLQHFLTHESVPEFISPAHAHELLHFKEELEKSGVRPMAKEKLQNWVEQDWRRSPETVRDLLHRIEGVFTVLERFELLLKSQHRTSPAAARSTRIDSWLKSHDGGEILTSHVLIAGLTSLPHLEAQLLSRLSQQKNYHIWLSEPPSHVLNTPLGSLIQAAGGSLRNQDHPWGQGVQELVSVPDVTHEIVAALKWAQNLIDQKKIPAHEIGIIVPDESVYGSYLAAWAPQFLSDPNIPLSEPWTNSPIGRWLGLIKDCLRNSSAYLWGQFFLHDYTESIFATSLSREELLQGRMLLQKQLKNFPEISHRPTQAPNEFLSHWIQHHFPSSYGLFIHQATEFCLTGMIDHQLKDPIETLSSLVTKLEQQENSKDPKRIQSWSLVHTAMERWQDLTKIPIKNPRNEWRHTLDGVFHLVSSQGLRGVGEPMKGLQIIGLTEARYIPFAAVWMVGCYEGSFPHGLPRDQLIDNQMRHALNIPHWSDLEALEETTFHLLTARLRHVVLSYPRQVGESHVVRSRWVERLAMNLSIKELSSADIFEARTLTSPKDPGLEGLVSDAFLLTAQVSPSSLRHLIWCPYRFLLSKRKIESVEEPQEQVNLKLGTYLHRVMEHFFSGASDAVIPAHLTLLKKPSSPKDLGPWILERLHELALILIPRIFSRHLSVQQMIGTGFQRLQERLCLLATSGYDFQNVQTEIRLGGTKTIEILGRSITVQGTIDAVFHRNGTSNLIVDYKTGQTPPISMVRKGLEPQLILYAWSMGDKETLPPSALCYLSLTDGKMTIASCREDIRSSLIDDHLLSKSQKPAPLDESFQALRSIWETRLAQIEETGRFMADSSDCKFCSFDNVCRKNDPRVSEIIKSQQVIKPHG